MSIDILIILINYYQEDEIIHFIDTIAFDARQLKLSILVFDNGSRDSEGFKVRLSRSSHVFYCSSEQNLGYFGGAHRGLEEFLSRGNPMPEWVIVMNSDIEFPAEDFMVTFLKEASGAQVAAPSIYSTLSRNRQNPFSEQTYPIRHLRFLSCVYSNYTAYLLYQTLSYMKRRWKSLDTPPLGIKRKVYALHGSFLAFNRSYFELGASLKYGTFLFGEELFVAEQVKAINGECRYIPNLEIKHREHASTGRYKSRQLVRFLKESTDFLLKEVYHG